MAIVGKIEAGIPLPVVPVLTVSTLTSGMLLDSVILAVVCFAIAFSVGKIYAKKHGYVIRANQELFALGSANTVASFFSCFPATASLSRTAVMGETAKSHISSLVSCVLLVLLLLFFAPLLSNLPKSVVAVVIIVAQKTLVMQVKDFLPSWNMSRWEGVRNQTLMKLVLTQQLVSQLVWLVTFVSVLLLGIDYGLVVGILFSIFMIVKRNTGMKLRLLGRVHDSETLVDIEINRNAYVSNWCFQKERLNRMLLFTQELPGVKIIQLSTPLLFLNNELFKEMITKQFMWLQPVMETSDCEYTSVETVILDFGPVSYVDTSGAATIIEVVSVEKILVLTATLFP